MILTKQKQKQKQKLYDHHLTNGYVDKILLFAAAWIDLVYTWSVLC